MTTSTGRSRHTNQTPWEEENVRDIIAATLKNKSDMGVIFDGDADR
jgi:phosphomannomutase